jgi:hypothetical protein
MGLAFLPIEIDVQLPDEQKLLEFCNQHKLVIPKEDNHSWWWNVIPVVMRADREVVYNNPKELQNLIANRYNTNIGTPQYLNDIDKIFPEIPYMLNQLPFIEMTTVVIMQQKEAVDYHIDINDFDSILDHSELAYELEPRRYNILLNKHEYKDCFFVSHEQGGEKVYPLIPKDRPCHVISNGYFAHGADYCGPDKMMLCVIGGILDRPRHLKMIQDNYNKFRNDAIMFGDIL